MLKWQRKGVPGADWDQHLKPLTSTDDAYHDGKDALAAISALERLQNLNRPFFLALGFHKPHLPFNAPKRYWDMYDAESLAPCRESL